jgi:hypothetical protein
MNNNNYATMVDSRSRIRFKRLIAEWAEAEIMDNPPEGTSFNFMPVALVLDEIETTYKDLETNFDKTSPAVEKVAERVERIADRVYKMINTIRIQNDGMDDDDEDTDNDD